MIQGSGSLGPNLSLFDQWEFCWWLQWEQNLALDAVVILSEQLCNAAGLFVKQVAYSLNRTVPVIGRSRIFGVVFFYWTNSRCFMHILWIILATTELVTGIILRGLPIARDCIQNHSANSIYSTFQSRAFLLLASSQDRIQALLAFFPWRGNIVLFYFRVSFYTAL